MYDYFMDDVNVDKNSKGTEKCVIKWETKFEDYKTCLENNKTILTTQQRFRSDAKMYSMKK